MATVVNIPSILSPIKAPTVVANNTTLFHIAAQQLGDATDWNYVLALNPKLINADGFWEYVLPGASTINVPPVGSVTSNGGILNAFPAPGVTVTRDFSSGFNYGFT